MKKEPLRFYPEHPSAEKTHKIETTPMPLLRQKEPFAIKPLCREFQRDLNSALAIYEAKRFSVTGTAIKVGPDIHHKPSIELSDETGNPCYALCIFPTKDFYDTVSPGDTVTVRGNYLVMSNHYGIVMKCCELVDTENPRKE